MYQFELEDFIEMDFCRRIAAEKYPGSVQPDSVISRNIINTAIQDVSSGIQDGISPVQFMDSINTANSTLGNHSFMQFVGALQAQRKHSDAHTTAAGGIQGSGRPLTHLDPLQQAFGHHDISGMREHTGPGTRAALDTLGAEGFSSTGRMALADNPDLYTQAHEAAHGVQQAALGNSMTLEGGVGAAGDRYERHADKVADAVVAGRDAQPILDRLAPQPTAVAAGPVGANALLQMADRPPKQTEAPTEGTSKKKKTGKPSPEEIAAMRAAKETAKKARPQKKGKEGAAKKAITGKPEKGAADPEKSFRSVATGNFRQLDPVTGDASCEMRVPFMLDAMDILATSGFNPESLIPGFSSMYGPEFNVLPADVGSKKGSLPKSGTMPEHYFSLFYPLSVIRQRADDTLRFLIDDEPEGMTYSSGDVNRWKSAAAQYNVDYMRKVARVQAARTGGQAPVMGQISRMLDESRIDLSKGGYRQPILPIFSAEYFLSQNEYLRGRPVVLVLTRFGYDNAGGQYHFGTRVYMYRPNRAENFSDKKFELDQAAPGAEEAERGSTVIHAFNMFPLGRTERENYEATASFTGEEKFFNSPDNREFEAGFIRCDFDHLLRMWGAAHPPAPSSAVAQGFGPGQSREYIEEKHRANQSGSAVRDYKLSGHTSLFGGADTNLSDEYFAYKKMADRYGITGIRYASEPAEMHKSYYVAPLGRAGEDVPLREWTTMSDAAFSDVASASGAKAQRDRITYIPKHYRRTSRPIPFSGVHCFLSSYDEEKRHADELNAKFPPDRKFARDIQMELVSGTFFEQPKKMKGQPVKKDLAFWTVEETIDEEHRTSVQYPDSKTELGYETAETPEDRRVLADKMTKIARTLRAVGDIASELIERALEIIDTRP